MAAMYETTLAILSKIVSPDNAIRSVGANEVTDVYRDLDTLCQDAICATLVTAALCESDPTAQESQLHALGQMHEWDAARPELLANRVSLDRKRLDQQRTEYVDYLLGDPYNDAS